MKTTLSPSHAAVEDALSALADGELRGDTLAQTLAACGHDPASLARWHDYHFIGDVLRSPDLARERPTASFLTRLQTRLAQEKWPPAAQTVDSLLMPASLLTTMQAAANDSTFRWKMTAGFASVVAVAVMVWTVALPTSLTGSQLAQSQTLSPAHLGNDANAQVLVASPQGILLRDARWEALLAAHKQASGNSALQMPSGFLRNATFETSLNARR